MSGFRVLNLLCLVIQLGIFGKLVLAKLDPHSLFHVWPWWMICFPLYGPLLFCVFSLTLTWLHDQAHHTVFPRTPLHP